MLDTPAPGVAVLRRSPFRLEGRLAERAVRTLRFRMPSPTRAEWDGEVQLFSAKTASSTYPVDARRVAQSMGGPLAMATSPPLAHLETVRAGMYLDVDLGNPQRLTAAVLVTHTAAFRVPLEIHGLDVQGRWHLLCNTPQAIPRPPLDIRLEASRALKRAGFRYLLVPTGEGGNAPIGNILVGREAEWGLERVGEAGRFYLFRVK